MTRHISLALLLAGVLTVNIGCCCLSELCCQAPCDLCCADPCGGYCADGEVCDAGGCDAGGCDAGGCDAGGCDAGGCDAGGCDASCCGDPCCGDPCCGGCEGPATCFPFLGHVLRSLGLCLGCGASGCGDVYWNGYYNDPPDACDPCDGCGNWVGASNSCRAPYGTEPHLAGRGDMMDGSPVFQAPPEPVLEPTPVPLRSARSRGRRPARRW